jgi:hypothetical protein
VNLLITRCLEPDSIALIILPADENEDDDDGDVNVLLTILFLLLPSILALCCYINA